MTTQATSNTLVSDILELFDRDQIAWANVPELLAYARGIKPVVRLVVDGANGEVLADFCCRQQWPWRWSGFWLDPVFHTTLNDTFTRLAYGNAPADCDRVLYVGHDAATRRAEELEGRSDRLAIRELAMLYAYPECCAVAYSEVQGGVSWLEAYLRASDPGDKVRNWRGNKAAYLFPPHATLLPQYFPCSVDCKPTDRLARTYETVLYDYGLDALLDNVRKCLMQPLLLFHGSLYRFDGLIPCDGWYQVIGATERYLIDAPDMLRQPDIQAIDALRISCGNLSVRGASDEWCEPLSPACTQLLRYN